MRAATRALTLVVVSALCFGTLAIFGKAAYAAGLSPLTLLSWRFSGAAVALWAIVAVARAPLPRGKAWLVPIALGVGYFVQSAAYFAALQRIPASETSLLLYTFPVFVTLASVALFGERLTGTKIAALAGAMIGTALVVGAGATAVDPLGIAYGFGTSLAYTGYILFGNRMLAGVPRLAASAVVMTTAGLLFLAIAEFGGSSLVLAPTSWPATTGVIVVGTVIPVTLFLIGMPTVGASTAAIVSTLEPATTVVLATALLGERLTPPAVLGMVLILGATIAVARANATEPKKKR